MTSNFLCLNLKHHSEKFIQMMSLYFSQAHLSLSYFLASGFCWSLALTFAASILPDCIQSSSQIICCLIFRSSVRPQTDFWSPVSFALSFTPSLPTEATPSLQCSCLWVLSDFSAPHSSLQVLPWPVAQYQLILCMSCSDRPTLSQYHLVSPLYYTHPISAHPDCFLIAHSLSSCSELQVLIYPAYLPQRTSGTSDTLCLK